MIVKISSTWDVVVAQLVERSLLVPQVWGSNPVISKFYIEHLFIVTCIEKTKKKKRGRKWPFKNIKYSSLITFHFEKPTRSSKTPVWRRYNGRKTFRPILHSRCCLSTCDDDHKQKSQLKDKIYFKFLRQSEDGGTEVISFKIFSSLSKAQQV